ncbi:LptE family protein [Nemorincola caseinilytica]|uniref:LptE family protein n=1 Tax=Nemorincola caseinilytica TaxID=2054315 RepID=UPI0031EAD276
MRGALSIWSLLCILLLPLAGCKVYSFSGATIEGKTINIHQLENKARNVVPSLSATLSQKIQRRILSQTGLKPVTDDDADYDMTGQITAYEVTVTAAQGVQVATKNRLTISVQIEFKNRLNEKANFSQTFTRFSDFNASQMLQSVEGALIEDIGNQLADDIFNKAFVNW